MASPGRPIGSGIRLNDALAEQITRAVRAGAYLTVAAEAFGLDRSTLHRWIKRGRDYLVRLEAGGDPDVNESLYGDFCMQVQQARAFAEVAAVTRIREAMDGRGVRVIEGNEVMFTADPDWRAAAWYLERTAPNRWGRIVRTELSGPDGGPIEIADDQESLKTHARELAERVIDLRAKRAIAAARTDAGGIEDAVVVDEPVQAAATDEPGEFEHSDLDPDDSDDSDVVDEPDGEW